MRKRVIVTGMVQGVGFRWSTGQEAARIGVAGFVRNRADGTVEAEVEGPADTVAAMIDWLRRGPPGADVLGVEISDVPDTGESGFSLRS